MSSPAPEMPPAEADLIRLAREARGISPETAADQTPIRIRGARWRHIERGFERLRPYKPVRAPAKTLAHMAHTVGVTPDRLAEVGREDAAEILREILRSESQPEPAPADPRWHMLEASIRAAGEGLTRKERAQLRRNIEQFLAEHPEWQPGQPEGTEEQRPRRAG